MPAAVTVTLADALADPPGPLHVNMKVLSGAVSAPVLADPEVGRLPLHAPLAVHEVASADDQVRFGATAGLGTLVGLAVSVTVGAGVVGAAGFRPTGSDAWSSRRCIVPAAASMPCEPSIDPNFGSVQRAMHASSEHLTLAQAYRDFV